jgi:hypothetical protein
MDPLARLTVTSENTGENSFEEGMFAAAGRRSLHEIRGYSKVEVSLSAAMNQLCLSYVDCLSWQHKTQSPNIS